MNGEATAAPEYLAAHLCERLAEADIAELGVRVEVRGGSVLVWGPVPDAACRDTVLRLAAEALDPLPWRHDLSVVGTGAPDHGEDLS
ncbi:hypothetical protein [Streptomyces sp. cmx-4-9]|uniref:hypothetical protein n=1 Tax=Streptomyces sp. cmx-4-9 TaxID=2790941 RepID=UPI0039811BDD